MAAASSGEPEQTVTAVGLDSQHIRAAFPGTAEQTPESMGVTCLNYSGFTVLTQQRPTEVRENAHLLATPAQIVLILTENSFSL